jgi:hypothetical protein
MEIANDIDELKLYRGKDYVVNEYITIHIPTLDEICDYGEKSYYNMVYTFCSVGADLKWQLDDVDVDYTTVDDFNLFYSLLSRNLTMERTKILFGDKIDFSKMQILYNKKIEENVLIQIFENGNYLQFDRFVYNTVVGIIRKIHRLKRNDELPGNEETRQILIEDAREEYESNKDKPDRPYLLPLISAMVNSSGFKHNEKTVFSMNIYAFMDSVSRIAKIKNSDLLLSSGYSGFGIDLKKISKEETNWLGELN